MSQDSQRFWSKVDRTGACWLWRGTTQQDGYGSVWFRDAKRVAHRVAYELQRGPIGAGLVLRHTCDNRRCCNPDHLIPGTHRQNMKDMADRGRARQGKRTMKAYVYDPSRSERITTR